ncbi:hypothetical protein RRF57_010514 [Xylaria bambusicola]|uniref:Uncharacterized protein n=1 Tax=Xylaria bambusicola TaxID=326684 RepID=A0AAN7UXA0_9PEZI
MAEAADTHNSDSFGGLCAVGVESAKDGGAAALKGSSVLVGHVLRNFEEGDLAPDSVSTETSLV